MFKIAINGINYFKIVIFSVFFLGIHISMFQYVNYDKTNNLLPEQIMIKNENIVPVKKQKTKEPKIWQLEIESINLVANISEGTTKEVLKKDIGHFEETQLEKGNIGLAAHNRGYDVNYFGGLKLLKVGDKIKYTHNNYSNTYEVVKNFIIDDTDFEVLENTEENMLTLITCVENEPLYRRCVKAIQFEK